MITITAADVAEFLGGIDLDSAALSAAVSAAQAWVNANTDDYNAPAEARKLGTILLAAKWYKRRATASGMQSYDGDFTFVPRYDADVERLLGLNKPRVA